MPAACSTISLSVSDVVVINRGGKEEAHYCDSIGFTPVPEFMQESHIKTAEMSTEQNYNMIDGRMNNLPNKPRKIGGRISVLDRLHLKQEEIARKSGKPVPQMATEEEMERRRK